MTFQEKLNEMHEESLSTQKEFLLVIKEIRAIAVKGNALPEELIFRRDKLYNQFNKILKNHRRLINYVEANHIRRESEYPEGIELL
jgi:hypothetical protein